jgi:hypothetical protein
LIRGGYRVIPAQAGTTAKMVPGWSAYFSSAFMALGRQGRMASTAL